MKLLPVLIQVFFLTLLSKNATSSCPSRDQFSDCEDPDNYLQTYGQISCTKFNMADGLQAQWKFMNSEDIGLREQFLPYLNDDTSTADKFSETVKSLIELHRTIETYTTSNSQSQVGQQLAKAVAKQSCEWLNQVGILKAECNESQSYLPLLEEVYARLDFYDKINDSRLSFRGLFNTHTYKVNYCAWMNDRVLGNCQDSQTYTNNTLNTLSKICNGSCHDRRATPDITLCPA